MISHPSQIIKCFNYKKKLKAQSIMVLIESMQVYVSSICSLKRNIFQNRPPQPRYSDFLFPLFDFYKTCIGRHFIVFFFFFFYTIQVSLFLLCSQYLKREKINTQFQQATINLPPHPFQKRQKINIFANDRQVNVNSSYETQENRYSLPSYLAIIQKNQVKAHTKRT